MDREPESAIEEDSCCSTDDGFHIEFFLDDLDATDLEALFPHEQLERLRRAIQVTLTAEQVSQAEISVALVSGPRMRELNRQYLQHDYDTDVLSFCLEQSEEFGFLLGQLIVSVDYARQQSRQLSQAVGHEVSLVQELALYLVHGTLHLVGYDDQELTDREEMRQRERACLAPLGLTPVWLVEAAEAPTKPLSTAAADRTDTRESQS